MSIELIGEKILPSLRIGKKLCGSKRRRTEQPFVYLRGPSTQQIQATSSYKDVRKTRGFSVKNE